MDGHGLGNRVIGINGLHQARCHFDSIVTINFQIIIAALINPDKSLRLKYINQWLTSVRFSMVSVNSETILLA